MVVAGRLHRPPCRPAGGDGPRRPCSRAVLPGAAGTGNQWRDGAPLSRGSRHYPDARPRDAPSSARRAGGRRGGGGAGRVEPHRRLDRAAGVVPPGRGLPGGKPGRHGPPRLLGGVALRGAHGAALGSGSRPGRRPALARAYRDPVVPAAGRAERLRPGREPHGGVHETAVRVPAAGDPRLRVGPRSVGRVPRESRPAIPAAPRDHLLRRDPEAGHAGTLESRLRRPGVRPVRLPRARPDRLAVRGRQLPRQHARRLGGDPRR